MSDVFAKNIRVLQERWPVIACRLEASDLPEQMAVVEDGPETTLSVFGVHLSSCYDREKEARLQASLIQETASQCWVYGMGLGDLPQRLLKRNLLKKLTVVLMNTSITRLSLSCIDHRNWLKDSRVRLQLAEELVKPEAPFTAIPPELLLADDSAARLRDLIELELATPFIRSKQSAASIDSQQRLNENIEFIKTDGDVADLFGTRAGEKIFVAGAGPTLKDHFSWLKRRSSLLIAVDTAVKPLLAADICPDVVVAIDPSHQEELDLFANVDMACLKNVPLVYFPRVHPEVLSLWQGPRLTAYSSEKGYQQLTTEIPKGKLYSSGTVFHPAVDLAVRMGAKEVVFLGADFAYPNGMSHVSGSSHAKQREISAGDPWLKNGFDEKITTTANLKGFLRDLESYIALWPQIRFVNSSKRGALIGGTTYLED